MEINSPVRAERATSPTFPHLISPHFTQIWDRRGRRGVNQFKYHLTFKLSLSTRNISTSTNSRNVSIIKPTQISSLLKKSIQYIFLPSSLPSPAISAIKLLKNAHLLKINVHENTAQVDSTNHDFPVLTELPELSCNIFNYKICLAWPGYPLAQPKSDVILCFGHQNDFVSWIVKQFEM